MNNLKEDKIIQSGIVLKNEQIAEHTFHLKIQSESFSEMDYEAGFTVNMYLGDPLLDASCEDRKYSFWNYEPIHQTADFAICTFSNGRGSEWIKTLKEGNSIFFKRPKVKKFIDDDIDNYLLIGDITSLSHLYEINRNLPISKSIFSFIYAEDKADIFSDIDHSYPFNFHIIKTTSSENILKILVDNLPQTFDKTVAYIFGHPETCIAIHNHLKNECNFPLKNLRTKPFWKTDRQK